MTMMTTTMMRTMMLFGYYYFSLLFICTTTSILIFANSDVIIVAAAAADANINREEELNHYQNQHQHQHQHQNQHSRQQRQQRRKRKSKASVRPNFVIILTDDLDYSLGGINASTLNKTRYYIGGGDDSNNSNNKGRGGYGKTINNWFVQTPVCCASRAELLTGKMYHNLKAPQPQAKSATQKLEQANNTNTTQKQQHPQPHQCMHIDVDGTNSSHVFWDQYYFAQYFSNTYASDSTSKSNEESSEFESKSDNNNNLLAYTIGIFGKHLNTQNPSNFLPKGINEMLINGGGNYLNPSFTHGIRRTSTSTGRTKNSSSTSEDDNNNNDVKIEEVLFNNCTKTTGYPCYSTSVIGNASLAWIRKQVQVNGNNNEDGNTNSNEDEDGTNNEVIDGTTAATNSEKTTKPFFAFISLKAPHIQDGNGFPTAIPAPWYTDTIIKEMMAPRTPNYNTTGSTSQNPKHWLIRQQTPITQLEEVKIDDLYISRLKSLLSVDDLIEELITTLGPTDLNILDNTYIIFTSDNGYRLGQYQIPQCKLHPYENDLRVPFLIRGPGIYNSADNVDNVNADNVNNIDRRQQREQQQPTTTSSSTETETENSTTTTTATASVSDSDADSDDNTNAAVTTTSTSEDPPIPPLRAIFSHIHLMPTLLGLATSNYSSQFILPKTMDGTNLALYLIDYNPSNINGGGDGIIDDQYEDDQYDDTSAATAAAAFTEDFVIDPTTSTTRYTTRTTTTMNDTNTNSITDTDTDNKNNTDDNENENDVVSLLIEYTSLGNVIRYQHLVDTYNHSFIALRIMPKNMALQTTQLQTQTKQSQSQTQQQSPQDRHKKRYKKRQQQTLLHDLKQQQQSKSQQSQQSHHYHLKKKNQNQEKNLNLNLTTTLTTATTTAISRRRRRQRQRSRVLYNNSTTTTNTTKTKTRDDIIKFKSSNKNNNNVNGIISNNIKYIEFRDSRIDYTNTKTKPLEYELYDLEKDPYELNNIYYHHNNNNNNNPADNDISFEYKKKLENKIKRLLHCNGQSCRYEHSTGLD